MNCQNVTDIPRNDIMVDLEQQHLLYSNLPNIVIGFHGCDKKIYDKILYEHQPFKPSRNDYDWLGNGMYFWEHNLKRAWEWAECGRTNPKLHIDTPAVIGAVIDLGFCLDLVNSYHIQQLKEQYDILRREMDIIGTPIRLNMNVKGDTNLLLRYLDCAVIESLHKEREINNQKSYDSVRGAFLEGDPIYVSSGFREQTHIQLCVRNPNCIKGFFAPKTVDSKWVIP